MESYPNESDVDKGILILDTPLINPHTLENESEDEDESEDQLLNEDGVRATNKQDDCKGASVNLREPSFSKTCAMNKKVQSA